jgi:hypothetical protein
LLQWLQPVCCCWQGCGGDPFLGSWKYADSSSDARDIVIAKTGLGYRYTHVGDGWSSGWSFTGADVWPDGVLMVIVANVAGVLATFMISGLA